MPALTEDIAVSSCCFAVVTSAWAFCISASLTPWPPMTTLGIRCAGPCALTADFIADFAPMIAA
ncbi:Uncharacterised protein [Mycobacteroides abscessus subsp. abscessus]|nr:Uncharacterised protein [Mycobacteroides abscessus subsp. abscessus]SIB46889.1 Uncharacterised protein [Mycobacteroides abscessus subsp. abscessus]SII24844.1 Uncharacterised protein [Mycobacteroides abscessus subsp. abscessus]SKN07202.1 Uncharacterised protein [Mycobacteroides abscessus subsp. abscessus]SLE84404.1 Uncharacterised protein [Mycobacteroides abscessus subsp. abscessus]